jgi:hypothetical protein
MGESEEQCTAVSTLHHLLRIRLEVQPSLPPPPPTYSITGSVTVNAKTTVHCSPGSSMDGQPVHNFYPMENASYQIFNSTYMCGSYCKKHNLYKADFIPNFFAKAVAV